MHVLSLTRFVDDDVATVRSRLDNETETEIAPADSSVEVTRVADGLSRIVVRMPWDGRDEATRRDGTLTAIRYAAKVFDGAVAA